MMESLSFLLSIPPIHKNNTTLNLTKPSSTSQSHKKSITKSPHPHPHHHLLILPTLTTLTTSNPSLAAIITSSTSSASSIQQDKINLEAIVVSIDDFFNKYPFFVTFIGVIWLVVLPLVEYYLSSYKYTSALSAFQKLRDDPNAALLDIRDVKSVAFLGTPDLSIYGKTAVNVYFNEDADEQKFVNNVFDIFKDPGNTVLCVIDNFDGNSLRAAELLVKNGFKAAYAVKGGLRGKRGWQEIQEEVFPPSVHVNTKIKSKGLSKKEKTKSYKNLGNGSISQDNGSMKNTISSSSSYGEEL